MYRKKSNCRRSVKHLNETTNIKFYNFSIETHSLLISSDLSESRLHDKAKLGT